MQNATIVFALPFAAVVVLMAVSVTLAIREDWLEERRRERELQRKVRELLKR